MENPVKMDDLGGKPTIFGNTHISINPFHRSIRVQQCLHPLGWTASNHRSVKDEPISKAFLGEGSYVQYFLGRLEVTLGYFRLKLENTNEKLRESWYMK